MNKQRRKKLSALQDRLHALKVDDLHGELMSIRDELQDLHDEEEEAGCNSPIDGKRSISEEACNNMQAALDCIDGVIRALEDDNPVQLIDLARGAA